MLIVISAFVEMQARHVSDTSVRRGILTRPILRPVMCYFHAATRVSRRSGMRLATSACWKVETWLMSMRSTWLWARTTNTWLDCNETPLCGLEPV